MPAPLRDYCFGYWWTKVEYSYDKRTGAYALIEEVPSGWRWGVRSETQTVRGSSASRKGARAACRRIARKLPDKK